MSDIRRLAGIAGVVLAAMMIVAFVLDFVIIATTGGPPMIYLESLSADLARARDSAIWPLETWLYTLQVVPFAIFIIGVRSALRAAKEEGIADMATLAAVFFMALHTLHNLLILTVVQVLAPAYVNGTAAASSIETVARAFLGLAYAAFLPGGGIGSALLVAAVLGFAIAQRRTHALAAPSGRLAAASAVLMTVAYAQYVVPPTFFVALVGYLAYVAWTAVVSAGLLRSAPNGVAVLTLEPA